MMSADPVLSVVSPIGLAAAAGTALIADLGSVHLAGVSRTLRDLHDDGPTLDELSPGRPGIALVSGGGIEVEQAVVVIERLAGRWPAIVVRVDSEDWPFPVIPVIPIFPGRLAPIPQASRGVWQPLGAGADPPGPGPVLPRLGPSALRLMLAGRLPRRGRWIAAWKPVWDMPWA